MANFAWEGKTRSGQKQKGEMEAPNETAVAAQLRRQGISTGLSRHQHDPHRFHDWASAPRFDSTPGELSEIR